jgi:exosome complex RNA-binding protein Csl4
LNKNRAEVLSDMEVFEIKEDGDYVLAKINMYKYECAVIDILKIIGYAEIINPAELRAAAEQELEKIIVKYKNSFI